MRIDQKRILTTALLSLAKNIKQGKKRGSLLILKNIPNQTYLTVDKAQWRALQHFKNPTPVSDVIPSLILNRNCPPLRSFYELILKAVKAQILVEAETTPVGVKAVDWSWQIRGEFSRFLGAGFILFGLICLVNTGSSMELPRHSWEILIGLGLISLSLSLGYVLSASVMRGLDCEVYRPHMYWKTPVPHFRVDIEDAHMGGKECELGVTLMRMAPIFLISGLCNLYYPALSYIMLLGLFFVTQPFFESPALGFWSALFREVRLSTSHDFLFVQNRLLWAVINSKVKFVEKKYLLIYALYTIAWLGLIFSLNLYIFGINGTALLVEFYHAGKLKIVSLILLGIVGGLVLISAFLGLWILLKNTYRLLQSFTVKSRQRFKKVQVEDFSRQAIIDELAKSDLFEDCKPQTLVKIADAVDVMETPGRTFIINEGDDSDTFYHLLAGKVEVVKELPSGRYERIAVLERGDSFGEIALLKNILRTRSVRTLKKSILLSLSRENFEQLILPSLGAEKIQEILQKRAFLTRIPLCRNWHPQALQKFAALSSLNTYEKNDVVVNVGHSNQFFHIVFEGDFLVTKKRETLAKLKSGDFFGEISLLQNSVSTANVLATEDCKSLSMHKKDFLRFIGKDFFIGLQFEKISSQRLQRPIFPLEGRSFETVDAC